MSRRNVDCAFSIWLNYGVKNLLDLLKPKGCSSKGLGLLHPRWGGLVAAVATALWWELRVRWRERRCLAEKDCNSNGLMGLGVEGRATFRQLRVALLFLVNGRQGLAWRDKGVWNWRKASWRLAELLNKKNKHRKDNLESWQIYKWQSCFPLELGLGNHVLRTLPSNKFLQVTSSLQTSGVNWRSIGDRFERSSLPRSGWEFKTSFAIGTIVSFLFGRWSIVGWRSVSPHDHST